MAKTQLTQQWLEEYMEHIGYEITGIVTSYIRLTQAEKFGGNHPAGFQGEQNDCLDLIALHFRGLHEFFCDGPRDGYIRASHYVPQYKAKRGNLLLSKANVQVSHLTEQRHTIAQDKAKKGWQVNDVMKWLVTTFNDWRTQLPLHYRNALDNHIGSVKEFIDWYEDQMIEGKI